MDELLEWINRTIYFCCFGSLTSILGVNADLMVVTRFITATDVQVID